WVQSDRGLPAVRGISVVVHRQEIFGIAGVAGNGQRELVEALTGLRRVDRGRLTLGGRDVSRWSPRAMSKLGVAHIPEERVRRDEGAAVVLVSADVAKIRTLAGRIGVMYGGELIAVMPAGTDRGTIGLLMAGQRP